MCAAAGQPASLKFDGLQAAVYYNLQSSRDDNGTAIFIGSAQLKWGLLLLRQASDASLRVVAEVAHEKSIRDYAPGE
jgi:hypothetical protein